MDEILLIKSGELALKGQNRRSFEDQLCKNLRRALRPLGDWSCKISQSTIQAVPPAPGTDMRKAALLASRVFGIAGYSRAVRCAKEMPVIFCTAAEALEDTLRAAKTFKCEAKRADKTFALNSMQICEQLGAHLLGVFSHLRVAVRAPDVVVTVEIRERHACIHADQQRGAGGLPVGTAGHAAVLISGGIDSPVAAWMMARRGLRLTAIHFAAPPYTSQRAEEKVHKLLQTVANYAGRIRLFVVPFTAIQEQIRAHCPEDYFTLIMRRHMLRMAQTLAERENCAALITGESLGQVASQTLQALACTDALARMPVFRPLVGTDKDETVALARRIGTFETSILPYEDCCTVFTPRHPRTQPKLDAVERAEQRFAFAPLLDEAVAAARYVAIDPEGACA